MSKDSYALSENITAQVTLTNTGQRPALETVQLYIHDEVTSVTWATKELKAYQQVWIEAGQSLTIELTLPVSECSLVNAKGERVVELGMFTVMVGKSSRDRDLLKTRFSVVG